MKATCLLCAFLWLTTIQCFAYIPYKCVLKGEVKGRESKRLILISAISPIKNEANKQYIPIVNGKFEYTFGVKQTEAYRLIFEDELENGVYKPIVFFPYNGLVTFKLYSFLLADSDIVIGGELNSYYSVYLQTQKEKFEAWRKVLYAKQEKLESSKQYHSAARDSLIKLTKGDHEKLDPSVWRKLTEMEKSGEGYTPLGRLLNREKDSLELANIFFRYKYIETNKTMVSYYLLTQDIYKAKDNQGILTAMQVTYPQFAAKYPYHTYTGFIAKVLNGLKLKPGDQLFDATLPDLLGNKHKLSQLIKDKIALIDFWGSWCGPCIANSRTMVPIYNEFKGKGFSIIGIAKEYKTTESLKITLNREKYPWINLVEMNDKNGIWNKFGITNSTGMMFLVDKEGKILAIDPTAAEVKKELIARL